jgi:hypothetical protein
MPPLWRKLDVSQDLPIYIRHEDEAYYAREYIAKGGFKASEANRLILNLKKTVDRRGQKDWYYKEQSIKQFARELASLLGENTVVATIPTSKCKTDPQYDSRLEDVLIAAKRLRPSLCVEQPIEITETLTAAHAGGSRRPDEFYSHLQWKGFSQTRDHVVLIDDVLTTGSHFQACKRLLLERVPGIRVIGVFWAKTVWPSDIEEIEE